MEKGGWKIDKDKLFGALNKKNLAVGAAGTLGIYAALSDPAQAAVDVGLEVAARAAGAAAGPAAAIPMMLSSTEVADATATSDMRPATQEELVSQVRQREAAKMATQQQEATAEAAMQESDSFLTMQP